MYGRGVDLRTVERAGEIPLEEAPSEILPESGEVGRAGEEGGQRCEVHPGRLQPLPTPMSRHPTAIAEGMGGSVESPFRA